MLGKRITINSRKYDQSIRRTWSAELIKRSHSLIVVAGEFDRDIEHPGLGSINRGTVSYEYYWLDRWFNIFRFHEPDGALRNYYCNVAMPPTLANGVLDYVDLDIDIVVWPDRKYEVLDRDDFEQNALKYGYSEQVLRQTANSVDAVIRLIECGELPIGD